MDHGQFFESSPEKVSIEILLESDIRNQIRRPSNIVLLMNANIKASLVKRILASVSSTDSCRR